jgi:hypothetical protein
MGFGTECTGGGRIQHKAAEKYLKVRQAIWITHGPVDPRVLTDAGARHVVAGVRLLTGLRARGPRQGR